VLRAKLPVRDSYLTCTGSADLPARLSYLLGILAIQIKLTELYGSANLPVPDCQLPRAGLLSHIVNE
jgi:hypothetical protein